MKVVITIDIVTNVPEQAQMMFAQTVVNDVRDSLKYNSIIPEALDKGARFNTYARAGRTTVAIETSPVLYSISE